VEYPCDQHSTVEGAVFEKIRALFAIPGEELSDVELYRRIERAWCSHAQVQGYEEAKEHAEREMELWRSRYEATKDTLGAEMAEHEQVVCELAKARKLFTGGN
jgi:hypothetical protein